MFLNKDNVSVSILYLSSIGYDLSYCDSVDGFLRRMRSSYSRLPARRKCSPETRLSGFSFHSYATHASPR